MAKKKAKVPAKKRPVAKKTAPKRSKAKKAVAKKAAPKKRVAAKAVVKKKGAAKPAAPAKKKAAAKKAPVKKSAPVKKASVKPVVKKTVAAKPKAIPAKENLPAASELSEELADKAVHSNGTGGQMMASGEAPDTKTEDPLSSFDRHAAEKAAVKGDPHNKLHLSSVSKSRIRPSGKKPLWRK